MIAGDWQDFNKPGLLDSHALILSLLLRFERPQRLEVEGLG